MNPLWIPLASLLAALGADSTPPRTVTGEPLRKTIYDHTSSGPFAYMVMDAQRYLEQLPGARLEDLIFHMARTINADPMDPDFTATVGLIFSLAKTPDKSIWQLDPDAYEALTHTDPPWELARDRLPRLPFGGLLVQLPKGVRIPVQILHPVPFQVNVSSLLVTEEVPGRKWRYMGIADNDAFDKVAYSRGWLDLDVASAKAQLKGNQMPPREMEHARFTTVTVPEGQEFTYELTGEDKVWQLLLNLFLALEHHHLDGQRVAPKIPSGRQGRRFEQRYSPSPYTVVRLSASSKESQKKRQAVEEASLGDRKPMKRHLVSGHWRSVWVADPEGKPIFGTKPRIGRDGRSLEGNLYKTAVWVFPFWKGHDDGTDKPKLYRVKR